MAGCKARALKSLTTNDYPYGRINKMIGLGLIENYGQTVLLNRSMKLISGKLKLFSDTDDIIDGSDA